MQILRNLFELIRNMSFNQYNSLVSLINKDLQQANNDYRLNNDDNDVDNDVDNDDLRKLFERYINFKTMKKEKSLEEKILNGELWKIWCDKSLDNSRIEYLKVQWNKIWEDIKPLFSEYNSELFKRASNILDFNNRKDLIEQLNDIICVPEDYAKLDNIYRGIPNLMDFKSNDVKETKDLKDKYKIFENSYRNGVKKMDKFVKYNESDNITLIKNLIKSCKYINNEKTCHIVFGGKLVNPEKTNSGLADETCKVLMKNDLVDLNNPLLSYSSSNTNIISDFPEGYIHYTYASHNLFEEKLMEIDNDTQLIIHLMYGDTKADMDVFVKELSENFSTNRAFIDTVLKCRKNNEDKVRFVYTHTWCAMPQNSLETQVDSAKYDYLSNYKKSKFACILYLMNKFNLLDKLDINITDDYLLYKDDMNIDLKFKYPWLCKYDSIEKDKYFKLLLESSQNILEFLSNDENSNNIRINIHPYSLTDGSVKSRLGQMNAKNATSNRLNWTTSVSHGALVQVLTGLV